MGFAAKMFQPDEGLATQLAAQEKRQQEQLDELKASQADEARRVREREDAALKVENAQRALRTGRRRGLLGFTDDTTGTYGGSSA